MNVFQSINKPLTQEQADEIARTGVIPSHLKNAEDKMYYVIFMNFAIEMRSNTNQETFVDGEAIVTTGRHQTFLRIKDYLENDEEATTDLEKSMVMVEGVDASKHISLIRFIRLCNTNYPDDAIDEDFINVFLGINNMPTENIAATGFGGNAGTILNKEE